MRAAEMSDAVVMAGAGLEAMLEAMALMRPRVAQEETAVMAALEVMEEMELVAEQEAMEDMFKSQSLTLT